jgi:hypothetical protein
VAQAKLADIYEEALTRYDVQPYPGELTLFVVERHLAGFDAHLGGWGEFAQQGVRVYSLPFKPRGSLIEPYVRQLASHLRGCLDLAAEKSQGTCEEEESVTDHQNQPQDSSHAEVHS